MVVGMLVILLVGQHTNSGATVVALLICASPIRSSGGPVVRLTAGKHIIHIRGLIDSALFAIVGGVNLDMWHGAELTLPDRADVQVIFARRGREESIDVFAEKVA